MDSVDLRVYEDAQDEVDPAPGADVPQEDVFPAEDVHVVPEDGGDPGERAEHADQHHHASGEVGQPHRPGGRRPIGFGCPVIRHVGHLVSFILHLRLYTAYFAPGTLNAPPNQTKTT